MPTMYGNTYMNPMLQNQFSNQYNQQTQPNQGMIWVDGEVGAKAYQMPQGWPAGVPIALWDTNETIIYLKSMNPMGRPNPLQRIYYKMDELPQQQMLPAGQSGANFVTKEDLEEMKKELMDSIRHNQGNSNQNGRQNQQNGGGKQ